MEISYTGLHSLMNCEYSFFLRYIKHVQIVESSASVYGSAIHHTIKAGYDNNLPREAWAETFKAEWLTLTKKPNIIYTGEGDFIKKFADGQEMVTKYYDKFFKKAKEPPIAIELFFGRDNKVAIGNNILIGVFDQIDSEGTIIDYKSGVKPTKAQLDLDLQFTVYSYAYRQLFNKEEKGLSLRHLPTMSDITTTRTDEDFALLKEEVDKAEHKVKSKTFMRNIGRDCATCYFLKECLGKEKKFGYWKHD
jgi:RecB family exonuclease